MGGQTATENSVQIDMRGMNRVVNLDVKNKKITVQAGIRWRDIQEVIDAANLSIKVMQTYSNFTVGGSLSVNVHGRYIGQGPLIRTVDSIKIVLADGSLVEASPKENSGVFFGAIGGYGGLGVIVEATLQLVDNEKFERVQELVPASGYLEFFKKEIRDNPKVVFHNGDIYPPEFEKVSAVSWIRSEKSLTNEERLIPRDQKYRFEPRAIKLLNNMPMGGRIRSSIVEPLLYRGESVVWRNHEASYDVAELEPPSRKNSTFVLQEYFVPVARFTEFIPKMKTVFKKHKVKVFNVSIRHALPDSGSFLAWAPEEVFAFVVYYEQGTKAKDIEEVGIWTREMVDEVLSVNGRYYLPYQLHPTVEQFQKAYVRHQDWFDLKKKLDPENKFRNKLWDHYSTEVSTRIQKTLQKKKGI
jgi:FAD/FMN-containing dehydrogenase